MTIFVLGAGPISAFPEEFPRLVIAVSEGVFHLRHTAKEFPNVWALTPAGVLQDFPSNILESTEPYEIAAMIKLQEMMSQYAPFERLVIRSQLNHRAKDAAKTEVALSLSAQITLLDYGHIAAHWLKYFSLSELLRLNSQQHRNFGLVRKIISLTSWRRIFSGHLLKASSGSLGLLLALEEALPGEIIHVLGVTASRKTHAHDSFPAPNHHMHIDSDLILFTRLLKTHSASSIRFADQELRALLHD